MSWTILVAVLTLCLATFSRIVEGSWVAPAPFFAGMWSFYLLCAAPFFVGTDTVAAGTLWIWLCCFSVVLGSILAHGAANPPSPDRLYSKSDGFQLPYLVPICITAVLVGAGEIAFIFARRDFSFTNIVSYAAIVNITVANRAEFIFGGAQQPTGELLALAVLYTSTFFGGLLFRQARTAGQKILGCSTLIVLVVVFALFGSRMGALYGGVFWISAYVVAHILAIPEGETVGAGFFFKTGATAAVLLIGLSSLTQALRYSQETGGLNWFRIIADPFGFVAAFNIWFERHGWQMSNFTDGARTFRKIAGLLGAKALPIPAISVGFTSSNIFTVFRDLIEDFGSVGALIFLGLFGMIGRLAFMRVVAGSLRAAPWLIVVLAFSLTTFSSSIFFYSITMLATGLMWIYFIIVQFQLSRAAGVGLMRSVALTPSAIEGGLSL